jgi:hypothetical protein
MTKGRAEGQSPSVFILLPPRMGDQRGLKRGFRSDLMKASIWAIRLSNSRKHLNKSARIERSK